MSAVLFFTCGRGLEQFVAEEVAEKYRVDAKNIIQMDGKVFVNKMPTHFPSCEDGQKLLTFKSAERIFVNIYNGPPLKINHANGFRMLMDLLQEFGPHKWESSYSVWKSLTQHSPEINEKSIKRQRLDETVTFRISCKCSGRVANFLSQRDISKYVCGWVRANMPWEPQVRDPTVEVFAHLNNDYTVFGFGVTREPLSKRNYLESIALRPTICWAMAFWADIKPGDIVLDPMCGAGTLLTETVKSFPVNFAIGLDISERAIESSKGNAQFSKSEHILQFFVGDASRLPISDEIVDVVLCDFPFGLQRGSVEESKELIPKALREANRVLKPNGIAVFLTSEQLVTVLLGAAADVGDSGVEKLWDVVGKRYVKLGDLPAFVSKLRKCDRISVPTS